MIVKTGFAVLAMALLALSPSRVSLAGVARLPQTDFDPFALLRAKSVTYFDLGVAPSKKIIFQVKTNRKKLQKKVGNKNQIIFL